MSQVRRVKTGLRCITALAVFVLIAGCNSQGVRQDATDNGFGALGDPTSKLAYATALPAATAQEVALRGDVALVRGDTKRALFEYLQALQLGGADPGILYTVAKIHLLREDRARAELALKMVLNVQPEHAGANLELGVLCVHRREFETAESYLRRSLDEAEVNPRANNAMGVINDVKGTTLRHGYTSKRPLPRRPRSQPIRTISLIPTTWTAICRWPRNGSARR